MAKDADNEYAMIDSTIVRDCLGQSSVRRGGFVPISDRHAVAGFAAALRRLEGGSYALYPLGQGRRAPATNPGSGPIRRRALDN
jgi:hypothetical protein